MNDFFKQCGTAIMGSKTYEQALSSNSWFEGMEGIVFTSRELPVMKNKLIKFFNGDTTPVVKKLRTKEKDSCLVGGGKLITTFITYNLIDEFVITIVTLLLGTRIPLR